ncbi:MAG: hypothetical protein M3503_01275 [Actinomycetota bacterium]|nr:hypothetical protein [Actinomycetota bacterium]
MNYLGHVAVALATGRDDPAFLLGAALPDLASMAGVRFDRGLLPSAVADGVACHLDADEAFHAHAAFRDGSAALRRDLRDLGLATGPTRAIGHAGWELLLDGTLVGSPTEVAHRSGLRCADVVLPALLPAHRARWSTLLAEGPPPRLRYDEPAWVVDRLFTMLSRRPRLSFDEGLKPDVVEVVAAHQEQVRAVAGPVVRDLVGHARRGTRR